MDRAIALMAYARQAKNRDLEVDAFEIRARAERRTGELMAAQRETVGVARPPGDNQYGRAEDRGFENPEAVPTLAAAGIDKNLAHRARSPAGLSAAEFHRVSTCRAMSMKRLNCSGLSGLGFGVRGMAA